MSRQKLNEPPKNEYYGEVRAKTDTSADIYFYGDIVSTSWWAWDDEDQYPEKVRQLLNDVKDVETLNIYINSGGGSCFAGMAIFNMLSRHKAYKNVYVDGLAASMASVIALVGDRIVVPANAWLMIHQPWGLAVGNADDMEKEAGVLRSIEEGMLNTYCTKTKPGISRDAIYDMMKAETWFTGEEAAKYFNIETTAASNAVASTSEHFEKYRNMPHAIMADLPKTQPPQPSSGAAIAKAKLKLNISRRTQG